MNSSSTGVMKREAQPDGDFPAPKRPRNDEHLSRITDVPEDIHYEITKHLDPSSVLHLAQLSQGFRSILMSKSSSAIWKASRANVPSLPDLPPCLSEPQYVDFMFNNERCQSCLRQRDNVYVCYPAFSRTCSTCLRIHFHVANNKWERSYLGDLERLRTYVPTIKVRQTFQFNNAKRAETGRPILEAMTIPCITMSGTTPTFYLIPVSKELSDAAIIGQYPTSRTQDLKYITTVTHQRRVSDGMADPEFRKIALKRFLAFKDLAQSHRQQYMV